jgi:hypothetical protein
MVIQLAVVAQVASIKDLFARLDEGFAPASKEAVDVHCAPRGLARCPLRSVTERS